MSIADSREFLETLRTGDVIRMNGRLRVIRDVHVAEGTKRRSFTFAILRCSWTNRPYTVRNIYDLANSKVELVMRNYKPKSEIEKRLEDEIHGRLNIDNCKQMTCCDIHGIT